MEADLSFFRDELGDRRRRLETAIRTGPSDSRLTSLLREVDLALERIMAGTFGLCETCREPIERERLIADPLVRFCLDHLSATEQRALEEDLVLAARIQKGLLPARPMMSGAWEVDYRYEPAGLVSGDYCDLITGADGELVFLLGDVSGKGVAASMLMSHLHAMFRTLVPIGLPLSRLMERASRLFCESTLPTHYATLVCGKASAGGAVEMCNAGHLPPLFVRQGVVGSLKEAGLPVGMFCSESYTSETLRLEPGDSVLLYSDGITEAENGAGEAFGEERIAACLRENAGHDAGTLVRACTGALERFLGGARPGDDRTLMALRRVPPA